MWFNMQIYDTHIRLVLRFSSRPPQKWYLVSAISARDEASRLIGVELFLYQQPEILIDKIVEQFQGFENIKINHGLLYIRVREGKPLGRGFGRTGHVGIDDKAHLSLVQMLWDETGAHTPIVSGQEALSGLDYGLGEPIWE